MWISSCARIASSCSARQSRDQSRRHEHHGLEPADHHRHFRRGREHEPHGVEQAQPSFQSLKSRDPLTVGRVSGHAEGAHGLPVGQQPQREDSHADCPTHTRSRANMARRAADMRPTAPGSELSEAKSINSTVAGGRRVTVRRRARSDDTIRRDADSDACRDVQLRCGPLRDQTALRCSWRRCLHFASTTWRLPGSPPAIRRPALPERPPHISARPAQPARYRTCGAALRAKRRKTNSTRATAAPCQTKCTRVQPSACVETLSSQVVVQESGVHLVPFLDCRASSSSSSRRISARSSAETVSSERACTTSLPGEPPKARRNRSRTSCRWVCSAW